ncbi:hypothetical protein BJ912DRAFT_8762 [Pholiota molesta]|nr:hypothetical protein BJ912DRAFT_8762 [Pholiota molesta]
MALSCGILTFRPKSADITNKDFFSGYAGLPDIAHPIPQSPTMAHRRDDRASRKQETGNRLYNFLTRSRSRSRSKQEESEHTPMPASPPVPGSKPASRIPSRPLSSTTTTTNTTITPATPKPRKQRQPPPPADPTPSARSTTPRPSATRQKLHDLFGIPLARGSSSRSRSRSRPSSPTGQPIIASLDVPPLPSASMHDDDPTPRPRRSFTPQISRPRSPSPTPQPKVLRVTNATTTSSSTGSTAASIKISKFFASNTPLPDSKLTKRPSTTEASSGGPPILPPIPSIVSAQIKRVSSLSRRSVKDPLPPPATTAAPSSQSSVHSPTPPPKIIHTPPTPLKSSTTSGSVTASGSGGSSSSKNTAATSAPSSRLGHQIHSAKGSLDSSYRYRAGAAAMGAVAEEGPALPVPSSSGHSHSHSHAHPHLAKGKAREPGEVGQPVPRPGPMKMSSSVRSTKHGSFDFERPGWGGAIAMQRSGSGGTTGTTASGVSRLGVEGGKEKERESVYGPGLAGVGTLQREVSMKRAQEREEALRMKERARKGFAGGLSDKDQDKDKNKEKGKERGKDRDREKDRPRPSTSQRTTPDAVHASTSTGASATANGKSSSMGRAASKRTTTTFLPKRLIGLTAQHGPFAFEPAVPSPTRSTGTASTGTAHEVPLPAAWPERAERERARVRDEKERARSGLFGKRKSGGGGDRAPVPVPSVPPPLEDGGGARGGGMGLGLALGGGSLGRAGGAGYVPRPSAGHRSGTKGRSLDLGLGLAWAPSRVREEALVLPKSAFFARTASASSAGSGGVNGVARTASGTSGLGRSASASQHGSETERSRLGREVAEVFKSALDKDGYRLFKSYVHQFDAHEIPFDGPAGIVARVEGLLGTATHLSEDGKRRLLDKFVRIILQVA